MSLHRITENELVEMIKKSMINENQGFVSPVGPTRVNSPYGQRWGRKHHGVDLKADSGTPLIAPADGKVIDSKTRRNACGGTLYIDHGSGIKTRYCHLKRIDVNKGDTVVKGQVMGATGGGKNDKGKGRSTGAHLHYELYINGKTVDPEKYLNFLSGSAIKPITKDIDVKVDTSNFDNVKIAKLDSQDINTIISNNDNSLLFRGGSKGRGVEEIQKILLKLGYKLPKFGADGDYGNETKTAVKKFQEDHNLTIDGIVGISTAKKLREKSKGLTISESSLVEMIQRIITEKKKRKSKKKKKSNTLCARGKRAAKAKFEVYPSAYANGYAVQVCKGKMPGLDGKKKCSGKYCSGKK